MMSEDQLKAFLHFKNKHHTAVSIDTELGRQDYNDDKFYRLEKRAKIAWDESDQAERIFRELF